MSALARRLMHLAAVLLAVSFVNFLLVDKLPGDAALAALGESATAEELAAYRDDLGLDAPFATRYLRWLGKLTRGDLGRSVHSGEPVARLVGERLGISLELVALSLAVAVPVAVTLATLGATAPGSRRDRVIASVSFALLSTPPFVLGLMLMLLLAVGAGWFPAAGYSAPSDGLMVHMRSMFLPALALGLAEVPVLTRLLRAELVAILGSGYVRCALGKGLSFRRVLLVHGLPPASLTLVTVIALNAGNLIGGAVVIEVLFALPGMGRLLVDAVNTRDMALIQGIVLVLAVAYVVFNSLADEAVARIDPRGTRA